MRQLSSRNEKRSASFPANFMGPVIEFDPVTKQPKNDVSKIISMPRGCGEQNMAKVGPNVYAHKYLLSVGKMLPGSAEETGSIEKLEIGRRFFSCFRKPIRSNTNFFGVFILSIVERKLLKVINLSWLLGIK